MIYEKYGTTELASRRIRDLCLIHVPSGVHVIFVGRVTESLDHVYGAFYFQTNVVYFYMVQLEIKFITNQEQWFSYYYLIFYKKKKYYISILCVSALNKPDFYNINIDIKSMNTIILYEPLPKITNVRLIFRNLTIFRI